MMGHLAIYTYGKSTLEDASYNGLSLIYASELEAETLWVVSLLWTEKSAVFLQKTKGIGYSKSWSIRYGNKKKNHKTEKVTKSNEPEMTMMRLEALIINVTQKGLKDSQNLWLTVTQTMRSQASTKNVVKS